MAHYWYQYASFLFPLLADPWVCHPKTSWKCIDFAGETKRCSTRRSKLPQDWLYEITTSWHGEPTCNGENGGGWWFVRAEKPGSKASSAARCCCWLIYLSCLSLSLWFRYRNPVIYSHYWVVMTYYYFEWLKQSQLFHTSLLRYSNILDFNFVNIKMKF